jgi:hypothetical protein
LRTSINIDMRVDTTLAYEPELVQSIEQRRADLGTFTYQHQHFSIPQALGQCTDILHVIVPYLDFVTCELFEALKRADCIEIVVKNGYLHTTMMTG